MSNPLNTTQQRVLKSLKHIVDREDSTDGERAAARAAIARILKIEQEEIARIKAQSSSLAAIFKKRMNSR